MAEIDELGKGTAPDVTFMRFRLHADQREIIEEALTQAKKEAETEYKSVALEYAVAQYLVGPGKFGSQGEGIKDVGDMGAPVEQWFERVKVAAKDQDQALKLIFKSFDKVFPEVNLTLDPE
jgi:hypothetical protein